LHRYWEYLRLPFDFFFTRSLHQQLTEKLTVLGQGAAANSELRQGKKLTTIFHQKN
jgi:hypothetical protein